jgi:hypothetical protein
MIRQAHTAMTQGEAHLAFFERGFQPIAGILNFAEDKGMLQLFPMDQRKPRGIAAVPGYRDSPTALDPGLQPNGNGYTFPIIDIVACSVCPAAAAIPPLAR